MTHHQLPITEIQDFSHESTLASSTRGNGKSLVIRSWIEEGGILQSCFDVYEGYSARTRFFAGTNITMAINAYNSLP